MSMKCEACQVAMNSAVQYQQHISGRSHAKKLRQAQGETPQTQPQGQGKGQGQGQGLKQGQGRRRGRAIRGGGRGILDLPVGAGRGMFSGSMNFMRPGQTTPQNPAQAGMQSFGQSQASPSSNSQTQSGMFGSGLPGLEPLVMNALNLTAAALQSTNMGFGRGSQQNTSGNYQLFGSSQTPISNQPFGSGGSQTFGGNQTFGSGQGFSSNQNYGGGQPFGANQSFGNQQPFGNSQSFGSHQGFRTNQSYGNNQPFGNAPFGNSQSIGTNPSFGNRPGFGNKKLFDNRRRGKGQRPKQPPPPPKPKPEPVDLAEPIVFGDNMGVVSVSIEGENQLYCDVCCVNMTSPDQAYFHYRGAKHIKKAKIARLHEVGALTDDNENAASGEFYCKFCNVTVNSSDQLKVHQDGARHKKMLEHRKRKSGEPMETESSEKKVSPTSADVEASGYKSFVPASGGGL